MAIIQSILVGKGKGKIGNVVLSGLKGQTVAKQLNSSPSNPRTVAQTDNRVKMANAVLAWQFLSLFLASAKGLRKPLESTYNAFVRTVKNKQSHVLETSRVEACRSSLLLNLFNGNWFTISTIGVSNVGVVIGFSAPGIAWAETYRARMIVINRTSGEQKVLEVPITAVDFAAGEVKVHGDTLTGVTLGAAYIYDTASSKITNIHAKEI